MNTDLTDKNKNKTQISSDLCLSVAKVASAQLLAFLKRWEGERLTVYRDPGGLPTVGIGHLVQPEDHLKVGQTITEQQSLAFLAHDVQAALACVEKNCKVPLGQNQIDALASLIYNIGCARFQHSHLLVLLNAGLKDSAANEFLRYIHAGHHTLPGLAHRRSAERALFLTPCENATATT